MKVKFIGKKGMRFQRKDWAPGEEGVLCDEVEVNPVYFEVLDKKKEEVQDAPKPKSKSKSKSVKKSE